MKRTLPEAAKPRQLPNAAAPASERIKDIISGIERRLAWAYGQPRWPAMLMCDEIALDYCADPYVRQAYAMHPLLGWPLTARTRGLRLDPVEESYVRPDASENEKRNRIREVHLNNEHLSAEKKYARKAWQSEAHGRRHRRPRPKTLGLVDLAGKQIGKSRLIAARPFGETLKTALAKLTKNQRAVYQGRVLLAI